MAKADPGAKDAPGISSQKHPCGMQHRTCRAESAQHISALIRRCWQSDFSSLWQIPGISGWRKGDFFWPVALEVPVHSLGSVNCGPVVKQNSQRQARVAKAAQMISKEQRKKGPVTGHNIWSNPPVASFLPLSPLSQFPSSTSPKSATCWGQVFKMWPCPGLFIFKS